MSPREARWSQTLCCRQKHGAEEVEAKRSRLPTTSAIVRALVKANEASMTHGRDCLEAWRSCNPCCIDLKALQETRLPLVRSLEHRAWDTRMATCAWSQKKLFKCSDFHEGLQNSDTLYT